MFWAGINGHASGPSVYSQLRDRKWHSWIGIYISACIRQGNSTRYRHRSMNRAAWIYPNTPEEYRTRYSSDKLGKWLSCPVTWESSVRLKVLRPYFVQFFFWQGDGLRASFLKQNSVLQLARRIQRQWPSLRLSLVRKPFYVFLLFSKVRIIVKL
jgi:hypothetical protein